MITGTATVGRDGSCNTLKNPNNCSNSSSHKDTKALRITRLGDEIIDHAVKEDAIVETGIGQFHDVLTRHRDPRFKEFDDDTTLNPT